MKNNNQPVEQSKYILFIVEDAEPNVIPYPFAVHIIGDKKSVVVFDYPLVYQAD